MNRHQFTRHFQAVIMARERFAEEFKAEAVRKVFERGFSRWCKTDSECLRRVFISGLEPANSNQDKKYDGGRAIIFLRRPCFIGLMGYSPVFCIAG